MAQSATTVTPPNPTPPTNMGFTGATGPNPPNFTRQHYANPFNLNAQGQPQAPYGVNPNPPPYYDDGAAGGLTQITSAQPALAGGTSASDNAGSAPGFVGTAVGGAGGTGVNSTLGTYPGTAAGVVPASTSVEGEGRGTEVVITAPGNIDHTYPGPVVFSMGKSVSTMAGGFTGVANAPNQQHASSLSPLTNPTLTSMSAGGASGTGTATATATGTGFTKQSVLWINGIAYPTTFVSSTSLTAVAPKKATAGSLPCVVITGGAVQTASQNWTFT